MNNNIFVKRYSKFQKQSFPFIYLMIAFPVIQFAVFWVGVNFSSIALAFQNLQGAFTFNNIEAVINGFLGKSSGYKLGEALGNSLTLWTVSHFICFPVCIVTTYILYRKIFAHYFFRVCYIIPSLMGAIMWTSLIQYMMQYDGIVVKVITDLGFHLPEQALDQGLFGSIETAFPTLVTLTLIMGLVGNNAVLTGAFSRLPEELYESAELDGAGFWTVCFKIAIPCIWSTITTLMIFGLCGIFTADSNVYLYSNGTGEPGMSTIGFILYKMTYDISLAGSDSASYNYPAAVGFVLTVMTVPIVLLGRWVLEKIQENVEV